MGEFGKAVIGEGKYGGQFTSYADNGIGVSASASGTNAFAGHFSGRGYFSRNVGIETENPQSKLSVGGQGVVEASIYSKVDFDVGISVFGSALTSNPNGVTNYGGYFESNGEYGIGVWGNAMGEFGKGVIGEGKYGGQFTSYADNGIGGQFTVYADNGVGVQASANGTNAYAGFFNGRSYFSGNVGIGIEQPTYKLQIRDVIDGNFVAKIENSSIATNANGIAILVGAATPTASNHFIRFQKFGSAGIGSISGNGSGGVAYNTTSDARLKMNIKEYSNALETLSNIGIKKYERIANPGIEEIGVIAQELQKVYPQAVSGSPDSDVKTDPMMVDYSKLTPLLVKAVQEQQGIIKTQESSIKTQDERIKELEMQNLEVSSKNEELENRLSKLESLLDGKRFKTVSK